MNQKAIRKHHSSAVKTRILIVDDHPIVRRGLAQIIQNEPDLEVCGEAQDVPQALERLEQTRPDFVLLDMTIKDSSGIDLIKAARARQPKLPMLVVSMHDDLLYARQALRAGARGYIIKDQAPEKVVEAIRQVQAGKVYLSPTMRDALVSRLISARKRRSPSGGEAPQGDPTAPESNLSGREKEVLAELGRGVVVREIAAKMRLSVKTIETYREHLKAKLGLKNAAELLYYAARWVAQHPPGPRNPEPGPPEPGRRFGRSFTD